MSSIREDIRLLVGKYGYAAVHCELEYQMKETYEFLRKIYEPAKNNLVIPISNVIPDRIATPHHQPISLVLEQEEPPVLDLNSESEANFIESVQETSSQDASLKEVIIQAKSEMSKQAGEKFSKAKHREDVLAKHKELTGKGIRPESLLTKENLSKWLGEGMSYMRIARECTGVHESEVATAAKTFGLQSDVKKYIVMKRGGK
jgi:hypothetical protein